MIELQFDVFKEVYARILTTKYHKNIEEKGLSWYNKRIVSGSFLTYRERVEQWEKI